MEKETSRCPLCGKETEKGDVFCKDCQETARLQDNAPVEMEEKKYVIKEYDISELRPETNKSEKQSKKGIKKALIIFAALLVAFMIVGSFGIYYGKIDRESEATETAYWNSCVEKNTPMHYSIYLLRYPEGIYKTEAQERIVKLRAIELERWESIANTTNVDTLTSFLSDYPDSPYKAAIQSRLDSLAWVKIENARDAESYLAYLENIKLGHYEGKYAEIAKDRYDYLSQLKLVTGKNLSDIQNKLSLALELLSKQEDKEFMQLTDTTLTDFMGQKDKNVLSILDSLKRDYKKNKIKSVDYATTISSLYVEQDRDSLYFIDLPYRKQITYLDKKKKKTIVSDTVRITLNKKMKLQAVSKINK